MFFPQPVVIFDDPAVGDVALNCRVVWDSHSRHCRLLDGDLKRVSSSVSVAANFAAAEQSKCIQPSQSSIEASVQTIPFAHLLQKNEVHIMTT